MKQPIRTVLSKGVQIWINVFETAVGGFTLDNTGIADGTIFQQGTPVTFDENTRIAKVIKTAVLYAAATSSATVYQVAKNSGLVVGEVLGYTVGGQASAITTIDTTNPLFDSVTLTATLGVALPAGQGLFKSSAAGANAGAFVAGTGTGLMFEETTVFRGADIAVVLRGTLYARRVPGLSNNSLRLATPNIIYSQSF